MMDKDAILKELSSLPEGYISVKTIGGKKRYYLQRREGNKVKSTYLKEAEVGRIKAAIERRKELESLLNDLPSSPPLSPLSPSASSFDGEVMEKDEVVARFKKGGLTYINEAKAPLSILKSKNLESWLSSRSIDSSRHNSRLLKKILGISSYNDTETSLSVHAISLTDDYWFKPFKSKLRWKDVSIFSDEYASLALKGDVFYLPSKARLTPELTLGGSYEKCWKRIDGCWYLVKKGNEKELFSEYFCSRLAIALGIKSAEYELIDGYIKTKNFATEVNFEPLSSLAGKDDDTYEHVFPLLLELSEDITKEYLQLIYFDCLVNNVDRHNENCGFLRDRKSGCIISLSPNFDNNIALLSVNGYPHDVSRKSDGLIDYLVRFLKKDAKARELFASLYIKKIDEKDIRAILDDISIKVDETTLIAFLLNGQKRLENIKDNLR